MQLYMAPMEGLTGYIYRNAWHRHYGEIDRYFTPFITNKKLNHKEINDILPEHNRGMEVVPQILTNRAEDFLCIAKELKEYGYGTVNLNLGCPSGTVVAKRRGAGFLAVPDELDRFLDEVFNACPLKISIKTRIGKESSGEWEHLLAIYEKYPLEELIIHPRVQTDFYKNTVHLEAFQKAAEQSRHTLCYNGDICDTEDYVRITEAFPEVERVMLGRGILKNPALAGEIRVQEATRNPASDSARNCAGADISGTPEVNRAQTAADMQRLRAFHDDVLSGYQEVMYGDKNTLFKMKELWVYLQENFRDSAKYVKKIQKSQRVAEYLTYVDTLFRENLPIEKKEKPL